jgi:hypothetical protein
MLLDGFAGDARDLEVEHWRVLVLVVSRRGGGIAGRFALPSRLLVGEGAPASCADYLE